MIELTKHIEILLLENDCVIVPGLGGFIAHHQPAHYEEDEGLFLPPTEPLVTSYPNNWFQSSIDNERWFVDSGVYADTSYGLFGC